MRTLIYFSALIFLLASCKTETKPANKKQNVSYKEVLKKMQSNDFHTAKALEAINSGSYSYIKLIEDGKEFWAAVSAQPIEIGANYYYKDAFEMQDFHSKSLNRDFESIWFINEFYSENPAITNTVNTPTEKPASGNSENMELEAPAGGYSLADIFKSKTELKDQNIIVKGQVVKINQNIMGKNWIHIQDGTEYNGVFDLTVTSNEDINYKLGDIVTFEGTLRLNKDFGAGYKYDFLLENATH